MKTDEIQAAFAAKLAIFEPIVGQPSDADLTRLRDQLLQLLYPIPYDRADDKHNLMGILATSADYKARFTTDFPTPSRPALYDPTIGKTVVGVERAQLEAAHKAKIADWEAYECAMRETREFIISVVEDTWIHELRDQITFYATVTPRALLAHLWATCSGLHALDLLALQNDMQQYHLKYEGVPEYINALEDAQDLWSRADKTNPITDGTLVLYASTAFLANQRFPRTNERWEELPKSCKTWAKWKEIYKDAHAKAKVITKAQHGQDQFGAANHVSNQAPQTQGDALDEYFDALAAAATTDKNVLEELVTSNATLTKANAELVSANAALTKANAALTAKVNGKASPAAGARKPKLCPNCKKEVYHAPDDCFELEKNKDKRPPGWRSRL